LEGGGIGGKEDDGEGIKDGISKDIGVIKSFGTSSFAGTTIELLLLPPL
jgi:hypothetical protein